MVLLLVPRRDDRRAGPRLDLTFLDNDNHDTGATDRAGADDNTGKPQLSSIFRYRRRQPGGTKKSLTIGVATDSDYDGVYFSVQALRLYQSQARCPRQSSRWSLLQRPQATGHLDPQLPLHSRDGQGGHCGSGCTWVEASGKFVLCLDSHVLLVPGALNRLQKLWELTLAQAWPSSEEVWRLAPDIL